MSLSIQKHMKRISYQKAFWVIRYVQQKNQVDFLRISKYQVYRKEQLSKFAETKESLQAFLQKEFGIQFSGRLSR